MILRELVTKLSFKSDTAGIKAYEAALDRVEKRAKALAAATARGPGGGGGGAAAARGGSRGGSQVDGFFSQFVGGMRGFASSMAVWNEITDSVGQFITKIANAALLIPRAGDQMAASLLTINSVLDDTAKSSEVYEKLYQQVRRTGAGIDETAKAFTKFQIAMQENGRSTDDTIDLVTGLQAAMTQMGMTAAEVNSVTGQLGQALGSGVLSGEEWKTIRENMPALAKALRDATGQTAETMKKFVDDQKLTTDIVVGPLLEFARTWREKLTDAPLLMGREWTNLGTTFTKLIADLDRTFKLSERIARGLRAVSDMLERWRQHISTLKQFVDGLGDMRSALVAVVAMMFVWATATGALSAAMMALGRAIFLAFLPLVGVIAWFVIIEDFVSWIMGKDSLIGDKFGAFEDVSANLRKQFDELKTSFSALWTSAPGEGEGWLKWLVDVGNKADEIFLRMVKGFRDDIPAAIKILEMAANAILAVFQGWLNIINAVSTAFGAISKNAEALRGAAPLGDPGGGLGLGIVPPAISPGAAIGPAGGAGPTVQNNDINIQVPVTATGGSGAEVAGGARAGLAAGARDLIADLGGAARALSMSNPRAETAAA